MQVPISWFYLIRCNAQYLLLSCIMLYNNLMGYFLKSLVKNITMYTESKTFIDLLYRYYPQYRNHTKKYSNYGIIVKNTFLFNIDYECEEECY